MSLSFDEMYLIKLDIERKKLYQIIESRDGKLLHPEIISASEGLDYLIIDWYLRKKKPSC